MKIIYIKHLAQSLAHGKGIINASNFISTVNSIKTVSVP